MAHLEYSKLGMLTQNALDNNLLPHNGLMVNWKKLGLRKALSVWCHEQIPAQLFCCSVDTHNHAELDFTDTKRVVNVNNNAMLL